MSEAQSVYYERKREKILRRNKIQRDRKCRERKLTKKEQ